MTKNQNKPRKRNPGEPSTFPLISTSPCWIDWEEKVESGEKQGAHITSDASKQTLNCVLLSCIEFS